MSTRPRRIEPAYGLTALVIAALAWWCMAGVAQAAPPTCQAQQVPVTIDGATDATVYGELCVPGGSTPRTVELLVHGATYDHQYWDWPQEPRTYSYVRSATAAGHATFDVDRLGHGRSSRLPSALVTLPNGAEALHDVITGLRSGAIGGTPFSRVVWIGHSFGTLTAWAEAERYRDVDAFVLTGLLHTARPSWLAAASSSMYPAALDPKFADSVQDPGVLTTRPGTRGELFYSSSADPSVIALDEQLKDTVTAGELGAIGDMVNPLPPELASTRAIRVPTLEVVGDADALACGQPDGLQCTTTDVATHEGPYFAPEAQLEVIVVPDTGHDLQLHPSAPRTADAIQGWIAGTEAPAP